MKTRLFSLAVGISLGLSTLTASPFPGHAQVVQNVANGQLDWTNGQITVTGTGAAPAKAGMSAGQKRLMAQRAAVVDGYRQLAESINGVQVDAETLVQNYVVESDIIKTRVSALVRGAKVGNYRYMSDGTVEVTVSLSMFGSNSLSSVMVPEIVERKKIRTVPGYTNPNINTPQQPTVIETPTPEAGDYTGVIIDCRRLGVTPAMSPQILDTQGREIYVGDQPIDPDMVVNSGIVAYADSMEKAQANARVGRNPLIIKAVRSGGGVHKTDAVVSVEQGDTLINGNKKSGFFNSSRVVFLIDKP